MSKNRLVDLETTNNDMMWEFPRFKTFSKWPFKSNGECLPSKMAAAGWYCTNDDPEDPSAKCAFCLKELNGWEPTDDPWTEHCRHSTNCAFVKLNKEQKDLTIADILHLMETRMLRIAELQYNEKVKEIKEIRDQIVKAVQETSEE